MPPSCKFFYIYFVYRSHCIVAFCLLKHTIFYSLQASPLKKLAFKILQKTPKRYYCLTLTFPDLTTFEPRTNFVLLVQQLKWLSTNVPLFCSRMRWSSILWWVHIFQNRMPPLWSFLASLAVKITKVKWFLLRWATLTSKHLIQCSCRCNI